MAFNNTSPAALASLQYQMAHIHEDRSESTLVVDILFSLLAMIAVGLRFFTKRIANMKYRIDDWLILIALFFTVSLNAQGLLARARYGMGLHTAAVSPDNVVRYIKLFLAYEFTYTCDIIFIKASILCFYHRTFPTRSFQIACYVMGVILFLWSISQLLLACLQCHPLEFLWDKTIPDGYCANDSSILIGGAVPNTVTDFVILVMPLPTIWSLKMRPGRKLAISGIFMLGGLVVVVSLVRIPTLKSAFTSFDPLWDAIPAAILTCLEPSLGVICACLPLLTPLARKIKASMLGSSSGGSSKWGQTLFRRRTPSEDAGPPKKEASWPRLKTWHSGSNSDDPSDASLPTYKPTEEHIMPKGANPPWNDWSKETPPKTNTDARAGVKSHIVVDEEAVDPPMREIRDTN